MLILTDCPESLAAFNQSAGWSRRPLAELPGAAGALWQVLGSGPEPHVGQWPEPGPGGFWWLGVVVARAESSQFDALREVLAGGPMPPGPIACLALAGRKFHGQRGRPWAAAPGNLHLCVALEPSDLAARDALALTVLPALAVVDGIQSASRGTLLPRIKWVNDILLDDKKIGGVITATQVISERVSLAVHGIGLNVATAPQVPPTPFVPSVGCLAEFGADLTLPRVLDSVLAAFAGRYLELVTKGASGLIEAYREASLVLGREVCIWEETAVEPGPDEPWPPPLVRGTVTAIGADMSLSLAGVAEPVSKGRLAFAESCRGFRFEEGAEPPSG